MRAVHKYQMRGDLTTVSMPHGAEIVHVGHQPAGLCVWAEVDTDHDFEERTFVIVGTGHNLDTAGASVHVHTWQEPPFVWHLYEVWS